MGYSGTDGPEQLRRMRNRKNDRKAFKAQMRKLGGVKLDNSKFEGNHKKTINTEETKRFLEDYKIERRKTMIKRIVVAVVASAFVLVLSLLLIEFLTWAFSTDDLAFL